MSTAVEIAGLTKTYGKIRALDDVSFEVAPGTVTGLLGLNGAGKTTLFQILSGLFVADAGSVRVFGHDFARAPAAALARMGIVFQQQVIDLDLTVRQNLAFYAGLHGLVGRPARTAIEAALARFGLTGVARHQGPAAVGRPAAAARNRPRPDHVARTCCCSTSRAPGSTPAAGPTSCATSSLSRPTRGVAVLWATHLVHEIEARPGS